MCVLLTKDSARPRAPRNHDCDCGISLSSCSVGRRRIGPFLCRWQVRIRERFIIARFFPPFFARRPTTGPTGSSYRVAAGVRPFDDDLAFASAVACSDRAVVRSDIRSIRLYGIVREKKKKRRVEAGGEETSFPTTTIFDRIDEKHNLVAFREAATASVQRGKQGGENTPVPRQIFSYSIRDCYFPFLFQFLFLAADTKRYWHL